MLDIFSCVCVCVCVCGGGCVVVRVCVVVVCDGFLMCSLQFGWVLRPDWWFVLFWVGWKLWCVVGFVLHGVGEVGMACVLSVSLCA